MKTLRKKSILNSIPAFLILLLCAVFLIGFTVPTLVKCVNGPMEWEDVDFSGDIEGLYVTGTVYYIYDAYAQETDYGVPIAMEYVIDADDTYYIGLRANEDDMVQSEALYDASWEYYNGNDTDGSKLVAAQYEITGVIKEMPEESLQLYNEYLDSCGVTETEKAYFLPYYIEIGTLDSELLPGLFLLAVGLFVVGLIVKLIIDLIKNEPLKRLNVYLNGSLNREAAENKVESFLANAPTVHNLQFDNSFICVQKGGTIFGETDKLVWAYKEITSRNFVKSYSVWLGFTDGERNMFSVKNEKEANEIIAALATACPKAIFGYSKELDTMFKKDFTGFLALKYNAPEIPTESVEE